MAWGSLMVTPYYLSAQTWTQGSVTYPWTRAASSADGTKVVAVLSNSFVLLSINGGVNWTSASGHPPQDYYLTSIACSADGTNLIVAGGNQLMAPVQPICTSTNFGASWVTNNAPRAYWTSVASSSSGSVLAAASTAVGVYVSTNAGSSWNQASLPTTMYWASVSCSADGMLLAVVSTNGLICVSTNDGTTWVTNNAPNLQPKGLVQKTGSIVNPKTSSSSINTNWQAVACSADKTRLVAAVYGGPICISTDSGATWTVSSAPNTNWQAVASSADGTRLVAAINGGSIYTSADSGATWTSNNIPNKSWNTVTSSADGCLLTAISIFNYSYTLQITPHPLLKLAASSSNLAFSWIKPSTNFVLQQCVNLNAGSWATLTNEKTLNLSNLQYQVRLSSTNSSGFFRLIKQ